MDLHESAKLIAPPVLDRRRMVVLAASACLVPRWSGATDSDVLAARWRPYASAAPLYIEGPVTTIGWVYPQPHLELLHRPGYALPLDLRQRAFPAGRKPADLERMLSLATVPLAPEGHWRVELPELARLANWGVPRPIIGSRLGVLGYPGPMIAGTPALRADILFFGASAYPVRDERPR